MEKQLLLILLIASMLFLSSCAQDTDTNPLILNNTEVFCTMDAKLCPDGSSVGRIPPNCDFSPCPNSKTP